MYCRHDVKRHLMRQLPFTMPSFASVVAVAIAVAVGYLIGSSPAGVNPPFVPDGSVMGEVPPWPLFTVAVVSLCELQDSSLFPPPAPVLPTYSRPW